MLLKTTLKIWAVTKEGARLGQRVAEAMGGELCLPEGKRWSDAFPGAVKVSSLREGIELGFSGADAHLFIMATGIAVRMIAPLLVSKAKDPAVVVMDETGRFAISLVSGHIGGANDLASGVAALVGADAVITTATDARGMVAVDAKLREKGLAIENPWAIKKVNMALLEEEKLTIWDPDGYYAGEMENYVAAKTRSTADIVVDALAAEAKKGALLVRPKVITLGVGCNRGTGADEIVEVIGRAFEKGGLSPFSLLSMASIDVKADEEGILEAAKRLGVPIFFYTRDQLSGTQGVVTPSAAALKHVGTVSVCEAAAIQVSKMGPLVVPKVKNANVTAALAKAASAS